jgi:thymidine phosphorylase
MVLMGRQAESLADANLKVYDTLRSGRGLAKFQEVIARQGGDPRIVDDPTLLPTAPHQMLLRAERPGYVTDIDAEKVGRATMLLGAGRHRVEDAVDHAVGVMILAGVNEPIREGDAFVEVHYRSDERLATAVELLKPAWTIADAPSRQPSLLIDGL